MGVYLCKHVWCVYVCGYACVGMCAKVCVHVLFVCVVWGACEYLSVSVFYSPSLSIDLSNLFMSLPNGAKEFVMMM